MILLHNYTVLAKFFNSKLLHLLTITHCICNAEAHTHACADL